MRKTLGALLLMASFLTFTGCREDYLVVEEESIMNPSPDGEFLNFGEESRDLITKKGIFKIKYKAGSEAPIKNGYLLIRHVPDTTERSYLIDLGENKNLWFTRSGVLRNYSEGDPHLVTRALGKYSCQTGFYE